MVAEFIAHDFLVRNAKPPFFSPRAMCGFYKRGYTYMELEYNVGGVYGK
jgi:hypothetical protein